MSYTKELDLDNYIGHTTNGINETLYEHMIKVLVEFEILMRDGYSEKIYNQLGMLSIDGRSPITEEDKEHIIKLIYKMVEMHDLGKIGKKFQKYKVNNDRIDYKYNNYSTNHSLEGAIMYLTYCYKYIKWNDIKGDSRVYIEGVFIILSYLIASHHTTVINLNNYISKIEKIDKINFYKNFSDFTYIEDVKLCLDSNFFTQRIKYYTENLRCYGIRHFLLGYIINSLFIKADNMSTNKVKSNTNKKVNKVLSSEELQKIDRYYDREDYIIYGNLLNKESIILDEGLPTPLKDVSKGSRLLEDIYIGDKKDYNRMYLDYLDNNESKLELKRYDILKLLFGRDKWDVYRRSNLDNSILVLGNIFEDMDIRDINKVNYILKNLPSLLNICIILPKESLHNLKNRDNITYSDIKYFNIYGNKILDGLNGSYCGVIRRDKLSKEALTTVYELIDKYRALYNEVGIPYTKKKVELIQIEYNIKNYVYSYDYRTKISTEDGVICGKYIIK